MSKVVKDPRAKQAKFIREKLIPFVLREQGRGFAMEVWQRTGLEPNETWFYDDLLLSRKVPKCGTIACIGGSVEALVQKRKKTGPWKWWVDTEIDGEKYDFRVVSAAPLLGISYKNTNKLFYHWNTGDEGWPLKHLTAFAKAKTPLQQAKIACKFLGEIAERGDAAFESATA